MLQPLFFTLKLCLAYASFDIMNDLYFWRAGNQNQELNLNETFFASLESYHVNAKAVTEKEYPWIARVVHSRTRDIPYVCTAACIYDGVFVTAARCIISLKVEYTTVIYKSKQLAVRAFVVPSVTSSQLFDDVGFLVIDKKDVGVKYNVMKLYDGTNRTDNAFKWFSKLDLSGKYKVVGYVTEKGIHKIKSAEREFNLKEMLIVINFDLCSTMLTNNHQIDGFHVPCYHTCTIQEVKNNAKRCASYHGVEGGAIVDMKTNKLFGLATWGPNFPKYELPVGFSVLNSKNFFDDYECAKKIRAANLKKSETYQRLCD